MYSCGNYDIVVSNACCYCWCPWWPRYYDGRPGYHSRCSWNFGYSRRYSGSSCLRFGYHSRWSRYCRWFGYYYRWFGWYIGCSLYNCQFGYWPRNCRWFGYYNRWFGYYNISCDYWWRLEPDICTSSCCDYYYNYYMYNRSGYCNYYVYCVCTYTAMLT